MSFTIELFNELISCFKNNYRDNLDKTRFNGEFNYPLLARINFIVSPILHRLGWIRINNLKSALKSAQGYISYFPYLYDILEDEPSKKLLIKILAYRMLGHRRARLPLSTPNYWKDLQKIEGLSDPNDKIDPKFLNFMLHKFDLNKMGIPIKVYFTAMGILTDFIVRQYEYNQDGLKVKAQEGDVVIDGGGCWGDSALFFADIVGESGKVFSFEFIPFNLTILNKNVSLNPHLKKRISVIERPLWENSETKVSFKDNGPASTVSLSGFTDQTGEIQTQSIDDLVDQQSLSRLDFIKLDIEGAELMALKGALNSIKRFKPKLAVALYHHHKDFEEIPRFINELDLGYKFYLSHCTIHLGESILFATVNK